MIQIKKGSQILTVSKGSYKDTFEKLGYEIVNNSEEGAKKASSTEKITDNQEKEFIKEEQSKNEETKEDVVTSDELKVNIIGENKNILENNDKEETKSALEKALERKSNKPKGK